MIGVEGDLSFGNNWDTEGLNEWLQEKLPVPFEHLSILSDSPYKYPWRLLKASRGRLSLQCENPVGYDFMGAKGSRGKGWFDGKLYFGKSNLIRL